MKNRDFSPRLLNLHLRVALDFEHFKIGNPSRDAQIDIPGFRPVLGTFFQIYMSDLFTCAITNLLGLTESIQWVQNIHHQLLSDSLHVFALSRVQEGAHVARLPGMFLAARFDVAYAFLEVDDVARRFRLATPAACVS